MGKLAERCAEWDERYAEPDGGSRVAFTTVLRRMKHMAAVRFQPFFNDEGQNFDVKLSRWVLQFKEEHQAAALLLASKIIFITPSQLIALQRALFRQGILKHLLKGVLEERALPSYAFDEVSGEVPTVMERTLFIPNSDSSHLNSFVHVNRQEFFDRERRRLVGLELKFWTYGARRRAGGDEEVKRLSALFEERVIGSDSRVVGKRTLVLIEDFAGTGDDLLRSVRDLSRTSLPFAEILLCPVIATASAMDKLRAECDLLNLAGRRSYHAITALELPETLRCYGGSAVSYLDKDLPVKDMSSVVAGMSRNYYDSVFGPGGLKEKYRDGYGELALSFVIYTNCPDNSLPILWFQQSSVWHALFARAARYL